MKAVQIRFCPGCGQPHDENNIFAQYQIVTPQAFRTDLSPGRDAKEEEDVLFGVETQFMAQGIKEIGLAPQTFDVEGDGEAEPLEIGMWVSYITPNSPADLAGLNVGDTIIALDNILIDSRYAWNSYVRDFRVGQLVIVKFIRKDEATGEWYLDQTQVQIVEDTSAEDEDSESSGPGGGSMLPPGHP